MKATSADDAARAVCRRDGPTESSHLLRSPPLPKVTVLAGFAFLLFGGLALAEADGPDWHGVWVSQTLDCPLPEQVEALENGLIQRGPHWQLLEDVHCEALRGTRQSGSAQIELTGLCRSFGRLESRSWTLTRMEDGLARITGLGDEPADMKLCPR